MFEEDIMGLDYQISKLKESIMPIQTSKPKTSITLVRPLLSKLGVNTTSRRLVMCITTPMS